MYNIYKEMHGLAEGLNNSPNILLFAQFAFLLMQFVQHLN